MSLKEKASKLGRKAFITHIDGTKLLGKGYETTIWVQGDIDELIEGAQKEMRQLEKRISYLDTERKRAERLYSQALQKIVDLKNERLELKQKLQQLFKEFPDINSKDYALHNGWTNHDLKDRYGLFIADVQAWKKKFEEWLKEEKEAHEQK